MKMKLNTRNNINQLSLIKRNTKHTKSKSITRFKWNSGGRDISSKYSMIQRILNTPGSIYEKSKIQAIKFKRREYRKLFKDWCTYNDYVEEQNNLSLFHDHFSNLRKNVYPFTLIGETGIISRMKIRSVTKTNLNRRVSSRDRKQIYIPHKRSLTTKS